MSERGGKFRHGSDDKVNVNIRINSVDFTDEATWDGKMTIEELSEFENMIELWLKEKELW